MSILKRKKTDFILLKGDIIIKNKPFAYVLKPYYRLNHCDYCFKKK